jgi:hypothetical protein
MKRFLVAAGMTFFCSSAIADEQHVGDWIVDFGGTYTEAFTANQSGSTFGLFCMSGSCTFYLDTNTRCSEGGSIPMLINSDSGATYVLSSCFHLTQGQRVRYVNSIRDRDVVTAISSGGVIGFAIPLASGEFKVVRFSLNGATSATQRAVAGLKSRPGTRDTGLRDRTM